MMKFMRKIKAKKGQKRYEQENIIRYTRKMNSNYLSPRQIQEVFDANVDADLIEEEIKEKLNYPDIEFLMKKLMPFNYRTKITRKDINSRDVVKASILGDIIGSYYEFTPHDYLYASTIEDLPHKYSKYTDDTVLSIATMNAILENDKKPDFRRVYIEAYNEHPDVGYGGSFVNWAMGDNMFYSENMGNSKIDNTKGYHSIGNGCAMRLSFIPAYYNDIQDVIKHTIESVMVTHDHVESIKGSVVLSVCIWMALHGYSKDDIYNYYKEHYKFADLLESVNKWCQYNEENKYDYVTNRGKHTTLYISFAVPVVIEAFYKTKNYKECMREILSHFGDTDTLCAMAGGLCYVFYGETGFNINDILRKCDVPFFGQAEVKHND